MGIESGETACECDRLGKLTRTPGALDSPTVCILLLPWPATAEERSAIEEYVNEQRQLDQRH
jgi:hypothetical protein